MMIVKLNVHPLLVLLFVGALGLQGCALPEPSPAEVIQAASTLDDIPTWTPRPEDLTLTALPTATEPFDQRFDTPSASTQDKPAAASKASTATPAPSPTPKQVIFTVVGGNLNVHRGPSVDYNYVGVLYDGETAVAVGRDRISRWVLIELPSQSGVKGWVTTETEYSTVQGDMSNLPFITVEPAFPAYIRNCTKHELWIMPAEVKLLDKNNEPYNEERFGVGVYQVYDLEAPHSKAIEEIILSEGKTVDIIYDWTGDKSKCK